MTDFDRWWEDSFSAFFIRFVGLMIVGAFLLAIVGPPVAWLVGKICTFWALVLY
jgi:hypothetical protein